MEYNGPAGSNKWKCGGHGGKKQVWAICAPSLLEEEKGEPEAFVQDDDHDEDREAGNHSLATNATEDDDDHDYDDEEVSEADNHTGTDNGALSHEEDAPNTATESQDTLEDALVARARGQEVEASDNDVSLVRKGSRRRRNPPARRRAPPAPRRWPGGYGSTIKWWKGGQDWTETSCDSGQKILAGGCNAFSGPHVMQWSAPTSTTNWKCGGSGSKKEIWLTCAPGAAPVTKAKDVGDWGEIHCDAGQKAIGGGCNARARPFTMQYNGPVGNTGWKCGGHGGAKRVWVMCSDKISPSIVEAHGGDWTAVQCRPGEKLISGGCYANGGANKFQYNAPAWNSNDKWQCGGHGGKKQVWAICAGPPRVEVPPPPPKLDKVKCCKMPDTGLVEGPAPPPVPADVGNDRGQWYMGSRRVRRRR